MKVIIFFVMSMLVFAGELKEYNPKFDKNLDSLIGKKLYLKDFKVERIETKYGRYIIAGKSSSGIEVDEYLDNSEEVVLVINPLIVDKLEEFLNETKNRRADIYFSIEPFQKKYYFGEVDKVEFYNKDRSRKRTFEDGRDFVYSTIDVEDFKDKGNIHNFDYYLGRTIMLENLWISPKIEIENEIIKLKAENEEKTIQSTDYRGGGFVVLLRQEIYNQFKMYMKDDMKMKSSLGINIRKENGCYIGEVETVNLCGDDDTIKKSYE